MAVMIDKEQQVELKLGYLRELTSIIGSGQLAIGGTNDVWERIQRVSDSIEKDLDIGKPSNVVNITVKVDIDTSNVQKKLKELDKVFEDAKNKTLPPVPYL